MFGEGPGGSVEEKRLRQPGEGVAEMPMWTTVTGTAEVRPPGMVEIKRPEFNRRAKSHSSSCEEVKTWRESSVTLASGDLSWRLRGRRRSNWIMRLNLECG